MSANLVSRFVARYRSGLIVIAMASVLLNCLVFAGSIYMMLVYDSVLPSHSIPTLAGLFVMLAVLYLFQAVFDMIRSRALLAIGNSLHAELSPAVHYAAVNRPLRAGPGEGDGMQSIRDLDQIHSFLIGNGPVAFIDLPWVLVFLLVLFVLHFWLGLTALFGVIVLAALTMWTNRATQSSTRELAHIAARRGGAAGAAIRYGEASAAMGMQKQVLARTGEWDMQYLAAQSNMARIVSELGGSGRVFRIFLQSLILTVGALLVIAGKASGGIILASSVLAGRALAPVDQVIGNWRGFAAARAGWHRLGELLIATREPAEPSVVLPPPAGELVLRDVWVAPPGSGRFTLGGVSFALQPGQALGIIGPSAAGKTTLAKALLGVWTPARGSIRLDGATYDQWNRDILGKSFGYVAQQVELFEGTIGENICRFDPDASSEAIIAAARAAGMHDLIVGLDKGYATWLGNGGNELSAGQRQRLGLARALFGNPFLLVLDEPNSNLDAEGDTALVQAIMAVRARGGIVVMITHRPAALGPISHILLLRNGGVEGFGERDEILAKLAPKPGTIDGNKGNAAGNAAGNGAGMGKGASA
jgi:ATP-binding cassette subfamily C protein